MVLEALTVGGCFIVLDELLNGKKRQIKNKWKTAMIYANKTNHKKNAEGKADHQTFEILKLIPKAYGYDAIISIPLGLSFKDLEETKDVIETGMKCRVNFDWVRSSGCAFARIVMNDIHDKEPFGVVKTNSPTEVYVGTTYYRQHIISDMAEHPHILISGATGSGKSFLIFIMLINLINNNDENAINLFLAQISSKQDLQHFKFCKQTKYYASNLEKATIMYKYIKDEMIRRNKLIYGLSGCNTIEDYNKRVGEDKKLPIIFTFGDEFSFYMEDGTENERELNQKKTCQSLLVNFVKEGRSAGIYVIVGLQRPDKENMPPIFKSQLNTRIAFLQNNTASSLVVIDSGDAVLLDNRESIILIGGKRYLTKTLYLSKTRLRELIKPYELQVPKFIDLGKYLEEEKNEKATTKGKGKSKKSTQPKTQKPITLTIPQTTDSKQKPNKKGVIGNASPTG